MGNPVKLSAGDILTCVKSGASLVSFIQTSVCVCPPRVLKTIHVKGRLNNQLNKFYCFSMTLAIDTVDGHGLIK